MKAAHASGNKNEVEGGLSEEEVEWAKRVKEVFKTWETEQGKRWQGEGVWAVFCVLWLGGRSFCVVVCARAGSAVC